MSAGNTLFGYNFKIMFHSKAIKYTGMGIVVKRKLSSVNTWKCPALIGKTPELI
jgi:hypothetical protein